MKSKILRTEHYHPNTPGVYRGIWVFFLACGHVGQNHIYAGPGSECECVLCDEMVALKEDRDADTDQI